MEEEKTKMDNSEEESLEQIEDELKETEEAIEKVEDNLQTDQVEEPKETTQQYTQQPVERVQVSYEEPEEIKVSEPKVEIDKEVEDEGDGFKKFVTISVITIIVLSIILWWLIQM